MTYKKIVSCLVIIILLIFALQDQYFAPKFTYIKGSDTVEIIEEISDGKININYASKNDLQTLDGIGDGLAERIIEYRTKTPFLKIEDIMNVSGIGEKKFNAIKDKIKAE